MSSPLQYKFLRHAPRDGLSTRMLPSKWQRLHIDPWLSLFIFLNGLLGLTALYKQAMSFGIGFLLMFFIAQIPPKVFQAFSPIFYLFSLFTLIVVMLFGDAHMGAQRWIDIPGVGSIRSSEFM